MNDRAKCETCGKLTDYHADECDRDDVRRHKANQRRKASRAGLKEAMDSVGMTRVRGNMGGMYWE